MQKAQHRGSPWVEIILWGTDAFLRSCHSAITGLEGGSRFQTSLRLELMLSEHEPVWWEWARHADIGDGILTFAEVAYFAKNWWVKGTVLSANRGRSGEDWIFQFRFWFPTWETGWSRYFTLFFRWLKLGPFEDQAVVGQHPTTISWVASLEMKRTVLHLVPSSRKCSHFKILSRRNSRLSTDLFRDSSPELIFPTNWSFCLTDDTLFATLLYLFSVKSSNIGIR